MMQQAYVSSNKEFNAHENVQKNLTIVFNFNLYRTTFPCLIFTPVLRSTHPIDGRGEGWLSNIRSAISPCMDTSLTVNALLNSIVRLVKTVKGILFM